MAQRPTPKNGDSPKGGRSNSSTRLHIIYKIIINRVSVEQQAKNFTFLNCYKLPHKYKMIPNLSTAAFQTNLTTLPPNSPHPEPIRKSSEDKNRRKKREREGVREKRKERERPDTEDRGRPSY